MYFTHKVVLHYTEWHKAIRLICGETKGDVSITNSNANSMSLVSHSPVRYTVDNQCIYVYDNNFLLLVQNRANVPVNNLS